MPPKPNARKWNDVETAIATAAIVTTIGLWNLFATPAKTVTAQAPEPTTLPPTEPPVASQEPVSMPQVKIMFTQAAPQLVPAPQQQQAQPQIQKKKKNNNHNNSSMNSNTSVTQTKSS
jgi:hypothetical protein